MNTWVNLWLTITLITGTKKYPFWELNGPLFVKKTTTQTWVPFPQGWFGPSLVEVGPLVLDKKNLNFVNIFLPFQNYLPLGKDMTLLVNRHESSLPKDALCQIHEIRPVVLEEEILKFGQCIFAISHWKRVWPFIWITLNTLLSRIISTKFGG